MNYQFKINDFEGPLDLLLHLVKENEMDIYEINTSIIIDEYLKFIREMKDLNIDIASEYLVMATELIHLKSRMLLNMDEEEEEEFEITSEEDLKNKLIEYQKYKLVGTSFKDLELKRNEVFTKSPTNILEYKEANTDIKNLLDINDLLEAFQKFLDRQEYLKPMSTKITKKEYSVEERIHEIREILKLKKQVKFFDLFDKKDKNYIIVTFLSILEMAKGSEIIITQNNNFSDILIEVR